MRKTGSGGIVRPARVLQSSNVDAEAFEPLSHPGHLVRRLHQICVSVFLSKSKEFDLTHLQYAALHALQFASGIDQAGLGKMIATDRQTTSVIIRRLCEKGLVVKNEKNKRTNSLVLTGAARALIEIMSQISPEIDELILSPLSSAERSAFLKLLKKLVNVNNGLSRSPQILALGPPRTDVAR